MRKKIKWQEEENEYILKKCEAGIHPRDYLNDFNKWRASELFDKHQDPDFKIPRSYKSMTNQISRVLGHKISDFTASDTTVTIKDIENATNPIYVDTERKIAALRSAAQQQRQEYNKLIRELNFQDRILDVLVKFIKEVPAVQPPKPIKVSKKITSEEILLLLSDPHIGEVVNPDEMAGINEYNFDIYKQRMDFLGSNVINITKGKLVGYNFETLNVAMLGDMVTGQIHDELVETAEGTIIEWCIGGALVMAQFYLDLAQHFKHIQVHCVVGNHGRMHKKPRFKHRYVNWDYMFYMTLALMLRSQSNIEFNIPRSFFLNTQICGHEFCFMHGDNIRSWMGIPWYGINRMLGNFTELMASRGKYMEYFCMGHFHQTGVLDKVKGEKIINGSIVGGNEYSLGALFASSDPIQIMAGVHKEKGLTWRYPINLAYTDPNAACKYEYDINKNLIDEFGRILKSEEK